MDFVYHGQLYDADTDTYEDIGIKLVPGYLVREFELFTITYGGSQPRGRIYILMCETSDEAVMDHWVFFSNRDVYFRFSVRGSCQDCICHVVTVCFPSVHQCNVSAAELASFVNTLSLPPLQLQPPPMANAETWQDCRVLTADCRPSAVRV